MYGVSWLVVGLGVAFGAGGWLADRLTGFRIQVMGGGLSGVFLAVGGTLLGYLWFKKSGSTLTQESPWPFAIQYTATVLLSYAVLMVIDLQLDKRHKKERSASSRNV
jgi:dipeptide/tripeptide permease